MRIEARNVLTLPEQIAPAKSRFCLQEDAPVLSAYEAGRDGFWLHHYLMSCGIDNQMLEPSPIKVERRRRRVQTGRLDAEQMLMRLLQYLDGDSEELHLAWVPTPEQEDGGRLHRSCG